jgi:cation:H+ antiporter
MVLGIAAAISPIPFLLENIIDIVILLAFSLLVWIFAWTKQRLQRSEGAAMLLLYAAYVVYICVR